MVVAVLDLLQGPLAPSLISTLIECVPVLGRARCLVVARCSTVVSRKRRFLPSLTGRTRLKPPLLEGLG